MTQVKEISKGLAGRYLKKVPASAADAGRKSAGTTGFGSNDQKKNVEKGIKKFVNFNNALDNIRNEKLNDYCEFLLKGWSEEGNLDE